MGFKVFWNTKWISTYRYTIGTSTGPTEFIIIPHLCTLPLEVLWWMIPLIQKAKNLAVIYDFYNRLKKVTAPQFVYVLIPGVCKCYFYDKDFAGMIKYLEMGRLAGISRWALNTNISILTKEKWRKSDTHIREGDAKMEQQSEWCGHKLYNACGHEKLEETRNGLSPRAIRKPLRRSGYLPTPWFQGNDTDFRLLTSKPWENTFVVLSHPAHDIYYTTATENKNNFFLFSS